MKVSKNQVVCAWCHLAGLASGVDCTIWSSAVNEAQIASVVSLTAAYLSCSDGLWLRAFAEKARALVVFTYDLGMRFAIEADVRRDRAIDAAA
jgi:hypothetical protein